jgi:hypothetical protein
VSSGSLKPYPPSNILGSASAARPVATYKIGGVEVSVWRNQTQNGDMYNTTIRNSYKDEASGGGRKPRVSVRDLAVGSQLTSRAFQEIVQLKSQSQAR